MRLIISEKANTAKKIAQFLSEGSVKEGKHRAVPHHTFMWNGEETVSVGLKGHVLNPEYPEEYSNWQKVEPRELIDAQILKSVSEKGVAQAVTSLAKKADSVVIATDFDREGELIGVEALSLVFEANPKLIGPRPARPLLGAHAGEVGRAFDELLEVSNELADAGEARQDIDLIWGATLTRWVSRATKRYGSAFLSVGRVQSPTLVLIADRERERRAFIPEPYWELEVNLKNGEPFTVRHQTERFWDEARARKRLRERRGHRDGRGGPAEVRDPQAAGAVQHNGIPDGGGTPGVQPFEGGPHRRGPVHGRLHLLPEDGQHRLPALARPARGARLPEAASRASDSTPRSC